MQAAALAMDQAHPGHVARLTPKPEVPRGFLRDLVGCPLPRNRARRKKGRAWGHKIIERFHTGGTPPRPGQEP